MNTYIPLLYTTPDIVANLTMGGIHLDSNPGPPSYETTALPQWLSNLASTYSNKGITRELGITLVVTIQSHERLHTKPGIVANLKMINVKTNQSGCDMHISLMSDHIFFSVASIDFLTNDESSNSKVVCSKCN